MRLKLRHFRGLLVVVASILTLVVGCGENPSARQDGVEKTPSGGRHAQRIVSLAPSLTEMLFALGLGEDVVAVTEYCVTPEAAKGLPKVGAWNDVSIEHVISFKPTCVCLPATHPKLKEFEQLGIPVAPFKGQTLDDVLDSITVMGRRLGKEAAAEALLGDIRTRIDALKSKQGDGKPLRTLVMIGRIRGEKRLRDIVVAGDDGYFQRLLELAACQLVPSGLGISYPSISIEGIVSLDPDVIIEIAPTFEAQGEAGRQKVLDDWRHVLPNLRAVRENRVLVFTENYATVPGLRSVLFAENVSKRVEPFRGTVK